MPQPPENDAGLTAPRPEVFLRDLNLGVYKRFLVAYSRCDAAAGRPGGCEHFSCLGSTCNTPGQATNHKGLIAMCNRPAKWVG